ncbi:MAG: ankyrin repeat domain-containing protein [Candidatus Algichlamydia australiensis]|nr:ankyrin repeat domain-containing protein [Chlamydiales bacterium]
MTLRLVPSRMAGAPLADMQEFLESSNPAKDLKSKLESLKCLQNGEIRLRNKETRLQKEEIFIKDALRRRMSLLSRDKRKRKFEVLEHKQTPIKKFVCDRRPKHRWEPRVHDLKRHKGKDIPAKKFTSRPRRKYILDPRRTYGFERCKDGKIRSQRNELQNVGRALKEVKKRSKKLEQEIEELKTEKSNSGFEIFLKKLDNVPFDPFSWLTKLSFRGVKLGAEKVYKLLKALKTNSVVCSLDLAGCEINFKDCKYNTNKIKNLFNQKQALYAINLANNKLGGNSSKKNIEFIKALFLERNRLSIVSLAGNSLNSKQMEVIGEGIQPTRFNYQRTIVWLDLGENLMPPFFAESLAETKVLAFFRAKTNTALDWGAFKKKNCSLIKSPLSEIQGHIANNYQSLVHLRRAIADNSCGEVTQFISSGMTPFANLEGKFEIDTEFPNWDRGKSGFDIIRDTALHYALKQTHVPVDVLDSLVANPSILQIPDSTGRTPLDYAIFNKRQDLADWIGKMLKTRSRQKFTSAQIASVVTQIANLKNKINLLEGEVLEGLNKYEKLKKEFDSHQKDDLKSWETKFADALNAFSVEASVAIQDLKNEQAKISKAIESNNKLMEENTELFEQVKKLGISVDCISALSSFGKYLVKRQEILKKVEILPDIEYKNDENPSIRNGIQIFREFRDRLQAVIIGLYAGKSEFVELTRDEASQKISTALGILAWGVSIASDDGLAVMGFPGPAFLVTFPINTMMGLIREAVGSYYEEKSKKELRRNFNGLQICITELQEKMECLTVLPEMFTMELFALQVASDLALKLSTVKYEDEFGLMNFIEYQCELFFMNLMHFSKEFASRQELSNIDKSVDFIKRAKNTAMYRVDAKREAVANRLYSKAKVKKAKSKDKGKSFLERALYKIESDALKFVEEILVPTGMESFDARMPVAYPGKSGSKIFMYPHEYSDEFPNEIGYYTFGDRVAAKSHVQLHRLLYATPSEKCWKFRDGKSYVPEDISKWPPEHESQTKVKKDVSC